jgi:hypothetical protein
MLVEIRIGRTGSDEHGIDSPIDNLDNLIQNDKRSLQTGKLNQRLHSSGIRLSTPGDLLSALPKPSQLEVRTTFRLEGLEGGEEDTGDVLLLRADPKLGALCGFLDLIGEVHAADSVGDFGEGEGSYLHHAAHFSLCFVNAAGDFYVILLAYIKLQRQFGNHLESACTEVSYMVSCGVVWDNCTLSRPRSFS